MDKFPRIVQWEPALIAGVDVFTPFWSRDPMDAFGSNLTNATKLTILP